jgi:hypothetical protein
MRAKATTIAENRRELRSSSSRLTSRSWIVLGPVALLVASVSCGATPTSSSSESLRSTAEPIYGGEIDDDGAQSGAVVAVEILAGSTVLCSGSLVAPNVVLTARHCVSTVLSESITCDESGASGGVAQLGADVDAATIEVFTGSAPNLEGAPAAHGAAIFHTTSDVLCNGDLALVVLDTPITDVIPLAVRLSSSMTKGEAIRAVGYGENDRGAPAGTRFRKDGIDVLAVGETVSASMTPLGTNEFEVGLSICQGDSGGAAISETTGALVGVVSRGGSCTDDFGHVMTSLAGFESVFQQAFAMAGGAPVLEAPQPTPDAGAAADDASSGSGSTRGDAPTGGSTGDSDLHSGSRSGCSTTAARPESGAATFVLAVSVLLPSCFRGRRRRRAARRASSRSPSLRGCAARLR